MVGQKLWERFIADCSRWANSDDADKYQQLDSERSKARYQKRKAALRGRTKEKPDRELVKPL
jgi:hypothetical protein